MLSQPKRAKVLPSTRLELELAQAFFAGSPADRCVVVGLDEVGRGALAGPVMVGAFALGVNRAGAGARADVLPEGIADSKDLRAPVRERIAAQLAEAGAVYAVGAASAQEIVDLGLSTALTRASARALDDILAAVRVPVAGVILDGPWDYVSRGVQQALPSAVTARAKADRDCVSVAAASVLAKVRRDALMVELGADTPEYGWASNKGYGSAAHREAIAHLGPHAQHRSSWRLVTPSQPTMDGFATQ